MELLGDHRGAIATAAQMENRTDPDADDYADDKGDGSSSDEGDHATTRCADGKAGVARSAPAAAVSGLLGEALATTAG